MGCSQSPVLFREESTTVSPLDPISFRAPMTNYLSPRTSTTQFLVPALPSPLDPLVTRSTLGPCGGELLLISRKPLWAPRSLVVCAQFPDAGCALVRYFCRWGARRVCGAAVVRPGCHNDELSARKRQGQGVRRLLGHLPVWCLHRLCHRSGHQHPLRKAQQRVNRDVSSAFLSTFYLSARPHSFLRHS